MNKNRRKELMEWVKKVEDWAEQGESIKGELESICSDEQEYFDNMPENLQGSMRGMDAEEAIDKMNEAIECIERAIEAAGEAAICIDEI
jgi:type I restriction-modification system DNA methylase subunit